MKNRTVLSIAALVLVVAVAGCVSEPELAGAGIRVFSEHEMAQAADYLSRMDADG